MTTLTPDYLSIDYTTLITRLKTELANSDTFADYNFEGSNISILIELIAYIAEMNTFFANKIAKNVHIETADIYEAVNRAARQMGYEPKGAISSSTTLSVTVTGATPGNTYRIFPFSQIECPDETDEDGDTIKFANTILFSETATASEFTIDMRVRQGTVTSLTGYTGNDLVDNELLLPSSYAYDSNLDDVYPSLSLTVNDLEWTRVSDFWSQLSAYRTEDNVYMFIHDRYGRSKIVFSSSRNVPDTNDVISLTVLESLGADGNVGANTITQTETEFVYEVESGTYLDSAKVIVTNNTSSIGGSDAEDIATIKDAAKASLHTQYRNVTDVDYESHLEERSDVVVAQAWGEQEIAPSGSYNNYNRVFLSVIPSEWGTGSINNDTSYFTVSWGSSATDYGIMVPSAYNPTWKNELSLYVEPRKMISAYEVWKLPELVYFSFDFSCRIKRGYSFSLVRTDVINKLTHWFRNSNQDFNSIIDFNDIMEFLLDTTQVSTTDNFTYIKGIRNLNLRDIDVNKTIYEYNTVGNFPYYVDLAATYRGENKLRRIKLGYNQFPELSVDTLRVTQET